jgi:glycosyltransferase involved in cell wall biosynthesis
MNTVKEITNMADYNMPLVSIGIPIYNVELFIEKCIISVLNQTYPNLEILTIDDCGKDKSMNIIYELAQSHPRGSQIKIIKHSHNKGLGEARNTAIDNAAGKYIYFLDSDDFIEPDTILLMVKEAEMHQTDAVLASNQTVDYPSGEIRPSFAYKKYQIVSGDDAFANIVCANLRWNITITSWNILFTLRFLRDNNLRFSVRFCEDSLFLSDYYSYVKKAVLLPNITYNYVIREGSLMGYQIRDKIPVWEIKERFRGDALMTKRSKRIKGRSFYDVHCARVMKQKFRAVCVALKHRKRFTERITNKEIGADLKHPASLKDILMFRRYKLFNLFFYILGILPYYVSVRMSYVIAKITHQL